MSRVPPALLSELFLVPVIFMYEQRVEAARTRPGIAHNDFNFGALGHAKYIFWQLMVHFTQKVHVNVPVVVVGANARWRGK